MKRALLMLLLLTGYAYAQQHIHWIKFSHGGREEKPVGTIVISVESPMKPRDKKTDDVFGKTATTNMPTFQAIEKFIHQQKYLVGFPSMLQSSPQYYSIVDSEGIEVYLQQKNFATFFNGLRKTLKKRHLDKAVIKVLKGR